MRASVDAPRLAVFLTLSLVTMLAAAKAHGRQVRLEREHAGFHDVRFGGDNPPFVEALWRRDRVRFWSSFPVFLALAAALLYVRDGVGAHLFAAPLFAGILAFTLAGLRSHASLLRAMRTTPAEAVWRRGAMRGSAAWWTLVLVGGIVVVVILV